MTCEHGGNQIPQEYRDCFQDARSALESHRGYDPGALDLFQGLVSYADYGNSSETSRLLVELNRSRHHPQLFSEYTRGLSSLRKKQVLDGYYHPYRSAVETHISETLEEGEEVLHISIHSFTPVLNGKVRKTDIGLLFDPSRRREKEFCKQFKVKLKALHPDLVTRFNCPYLGIADGFPTYLRKIFPMGYYGIELEVNQMFVDERNYMHENVKRVLLTALMDVMQRR